MPLYDFKCECGYQAELMTKIEETPKCPKCKKDMRKMFIGRPQNHKPDIY